MEVAKLDKVTLDEAEALLGQWIGAEGYRQNQNGDLLKIAIIENLLQVLRYKHRALESKLTFEEFIQSDISVEGGIIKLRAPSLRREPGSGTSPILLQPNLLMYLLLFHHQAYSVYDIIENYIHRIWDQLNLLDFKHTRTGVIRCFTNTRFAAVTLRNYGLLQFTKKEAYKTWVLSLPGFLVASRVLETGTWGFSPLPNPWLSDLHADIHDAKSSLKTYDQFVRQLTSICEPRTEIFSTFEDVLAHAYGLMGKYWKVIANPELTRKDRQMESAAVLETLGNHPGINDFYDEFSLALLTDELLRRVVTGNGNEKAQ